MCLLRYNMVIHETTVLGPGKRSVLWTQGCSRTPPCPGCIGESARNPLNGQLCSPAEMARMLLASPSIDGVTISGGEPFDQAPAVAEVVRLIRVQRPDLSLILYTGHLYEDLLARSETDEASAFLLAQAQILIDGPYDPGQDDGIPYRGSANQRILVLDPAYQSEADAYYTNIPGRKINLIATNTQTLLVGVPSQQQADTWRRLKQLAARPCPENPTN